jgi:hemolysin III
MKRTKLDDRVLPKYTRGEEIFNMVSHIVGGAFGVIALVLCIVISAIHHSTYGVVSSIIYGISMILLYVMSSIYHGLNPKKKAKKVMQIIDHCTIFILIAGSYTPFSLCNVREYNPTAGWILLGVIWGATILGVTLNAIDLKKYKVFSMIAYLAMGWCALIEFPHFIKTLGIAGTILLVSGGVAYTVGTIFYGFGKKVKYFHSIFHLFILLGSILQFLCLILYVL